MKMVRDPRSCKCCSKDFQPGYESQKFCSQSCSAKYNNSASPKRKKKPPPFRWNRQCHVCAAALLGFQDARRHYCDDPKCRLIGATQSHSDLGLWLAGLLSADREGGRHGTKVESYARVYLLIEADWRCSQCGWCEIYPDTGLPPLEVDHIDGNTCNNFRSNLRVLCPCCHSLTPTYRRMNQKNRQGSQVGEGITLIR